MEAPQIVTHSTSHRWSPAQRRRWRDRARSRTISDDNRFRHRPVTSGQDRMYEDVVDIAVAITTYNSAEHISGCIESIRRQRLDGHVRIVVCDNASVDATVDRLLRTHPEVVLIQNEHNQGFSTATNQAIKRALPARFILVLNPDTQLKCDTTLSQLVDVLERDQSIAAVGCKLVRPSGEVDKACRRRFPSIRSALIHSLGLSTLVASVAPRAAYVYSGSDYLTSGYVDAVNGALMLWRSTAIADVGLLDESYWMYGEDLDWCKRASEKGWSIFYEAGVEVTHIKAASSGRHRNLHVNYWFHRAMWKYYCDHIASSIAVRGLVGGYLVVRFATSAMRSLVARYVMGAR